MRSCRPRMSRSGSNSRGFTALRPAYGAASRPVNPLAQLAQELQRLERGQPLGIGAAQLLERGLLRPREESELTLRLCRPLALGVRQPRPPLAVELGALEVAQDLLRAHHH